MCKSSTLPSSDGAGGSSNPLLEDTISSGYVYNCNYIANYEHDNKEPYYNSHYYYNPID